MSGSGRRRWVPVGFMVVWLTFWTSGILVAVWNLGASALGGEPAAAIFLVVWVAAAGFALFRGGLHLRSLLLAEKPATRPRREHSWHDGMDDPPA